MILRAFMSPVRPFHSWSTTCCLRAMVVVKSSAGVVAGAHAEGGGLGHRAVDVGRLQQLLGRDAAPVEAGPADLVPLDDGDPEPGRRAVERGRVAPRSTADDDDVVLLGHGHPSLVPGRLSGYRRRPAPVPGLDALDDLDAEEGEARAQDSAVRAHR